MIAIENRVNFEKVCWEVQNLRDLFGEFLA